MIKKRIEAIDALKGFAILLVVFGHAIQVSGIAFDENIFFKIIYAFHMPMFMLLSGLVASYAFEDPVRPFLKKKFLQLGVPFLAWYGLAYLRAYETVPLKTYIAHIVFSPDYGLWFLWVLFLNFCFLVFTVKMEKGLGLLAYPVAILFVMGLPFGLLGVGLAKIHFIYFIFGYLLKKYQTSLKKYFLPAQILALIIFPILVANWHRVNGFSFAQTVLDWFKHNGIPYLGDWLVAGLILTLACAGMLVSFVLVEQILKRTFVYPYLCKLGNYTLDVYVSHQYFLFSVGTLLAVRIFSSAVAGLVISLTFSLLILRRVKILNRFFLGGR